MNTHEDVLNIHNPSILLGFLKEPKESEKCEGDASGMIVMIDMIVLLMRSA